MKQKDSIQYNISKVLDKHGLKNKTQVCLIQMPYFPIEYTSLALGLLKGSLDNTNISSDVIYAAPLFAEIIGFDLYNMITKGDRVDMISTLIIANTFNILRSYFFTSIIMKKSNIQMGYKIL